MRRLLYIFAFIAMLAASGGCARHSADPRLTEIAAVVADSPAVAIDRLDAIGRDSLSDADRALCGLLTVKARDKAYITHSSDSLILSVIGYYERHRASGLYPEALYYGGRVYADMGDAPSALRHFQTALDELPDAPSSLSLKSAILSQTGRLLNSLRLYDKAASYLEDAITVNATLRDSINLMWNTQLLGAILLHNKEFEQAEKNFLSAQDLAKRVRPSKVPLMEMYLAAVKLHKGNVDSALTLIRPVLLEIEPRYNDIATSYASDIYRLAGITDSAALYAKKLIATSDSNYRMIGYSILLSPKFSNQINPDSIIEYASDYGDITESYLNRNGQRESLLQNTLYNYQLHERERIKAQNEREEQQKNTLAISIIAIIIILTLLGLILFPKIKRWNNRRRLNEAHTDFLILQKSINNNDETDIKNPEIPVSAKRERFLRESLREDLMNLREKGKSTPLADSIVSSPQYIELQGHISNERAIPEADPFWTELEKIVTTVSPEFKKRLQLLTGGNLKRADLHVALLIKCGISPTKMAKLTGRAKSTISTRREAMCMKIFDEKRNSQILDEIIRLL